jgi:hypothetical protein
VQSLSQYLHIANPSWLCLGKNNEPMKGHLS